MDHMRLNSSSLDDGRSMTDKVGSAAPLHPTVPPLVVTHWHCRQSTSDGQLRYGDCGASLLHHDTLQDVNATAGSKPALAVQRPLPTAKYYRL